MPLAFWLLTLFFAVGYEEAASPRDEGAAPADTPAILQTFTEGQGPTLVMLGGGIDGAAGFAPHARVLAKEFRVVRPQSLRIERYQRQQSLPREYSIETESAALARSLDQLGIIEPATSAGSFARLRA